VKNERLLAHCEGDGQLLGPGESSITVRYALDTWCETIATGSGTVAEMQRSDGFLWSEGSLGSPPICTLRTAEGQQYRVSLVEIRSQRARFYCL